MRRTARWLFPMCLGALLTACGGDQKEDSVAQTGSAVVVGGFNVDGTPDYQPADVTDLVKSNADNSFSNGPKEDIPNPPEGTGSIPPNKDDFSGFWVNTSGTIETDLYLYLAFERTNTNGSGNMDFEINHSSESPPNRTTPIRTDGDILVMYDFTNGGRNYTIRVARWLTDGGHTADGVLNTVANCLSNSSLPCWGKTRDLTNTPYATAAVKADNTAGEAVINLTGSGIISRTDCEAFHAAFLKSRSSGNSFEATLKDFVGPFRGNLISCGGIKICKVDDSTPPVPLAGAVFTLYKDNAPLGPTGTKGDEDTILPAFTCTTQLSGGEACCQIDKIPFGPYWIVETTGVQYYDLAAPQWENVISSTQTYNHSFVDPRQPGAIKVTKTAKSKKDSGPVVLAGATFEVRTTADDPSTRIGSAKQTDANGVACFTNLTLGATYYVIETSAPTGYRRSTAAPSATPTATALDCTDADAVPVNVTNTPLSKFTVSFESLAGAGVTTADIQCSGPNVNDTIPVQLASLTMPWAPVDYVQTGLNQAAGLDPGTYNCTIVIDP